jgi:hypothetical protein
MGGVIMDIDQLQQRIDALAAGLAAKGFALPGVHLILNDNAAPNIALNAKGQKYEHIATTIYWGKGDTLDEKLDDAAAWIAEQPDPEMRHMHDFMAALGKVIDKGRDLGIDVAYVSPLQDTLKRLSENILTDQRGKK